MYQCKNFNLKELLPEHLYGKKGFGWNTFDERLKITLDAIRDILGVPLICNNWEHGGKRDNCGARDESSPYYKPGSYHSIRRDRKVMAADLISTRMTAEEMRRKLVENYQKLPYPIRIEQGVSWLHVDVAEVIGFHIYFFNP